MSNAYDAYEQTVTRPSPPARGVPAATVRYLVNDVDESLPFYFALGFELSRRMGPPFTMVSRGDLVVWLSGPGTSAARPLSGGSVPSPGGGNRPGTGVTAV